MSQEASSTGAIAFYTYVAIGNEKLERVRGIANLIQEVVQNYTFGVNLPLEAAIIKIL